MPPASALRPERRLNGLNGCATCMLRGVCLPATLSDADVERFDAIVQRPATVEAGVDLLLPGTPFKNILILRVGHLQEFVAHSNGERRVTGYALPGDMVGFDGFATDVHVTGARSLETVAICQIRHSDLVELSRELSELVELLLRKMSRRLLTTQRLQLVVARHTARERVAAMLISHMERAERLRWSTTQLRLPMPYNDIATALGITAAALSRTLHQMAEEGLITIDRSEIRIVDAGRLAEAADGPGKAIPPMAG